MADDGAERERAERAALRQLFKDLARGFEAINPGPKATISETVNFLAAVTSLVIEHTGIEFGAVEAMVIAEFKKDLARNAAVAAATTAAAGAVVH